MKARIAILAALPREVAPLVRDWPSRAVSDREGTSIWECDRAIVVSAGMGGERVTLAFELAASRGPLQSVISVGYAGALRGGMAADTVYWPGTVIDAKTGERFECKDGRGILVTTDHVVNAVEKSSLADRWNADLVDMEAATVARFAQARSLPFRTLRAISDEAWDKLPDLNLFTNELGGIRESSFTVYIALRPWLIPTAVRLGKQASQASQRICQALRYVLEQAE
ncbi:MAG: phosphorylase [Terriglobia bacterium]|nr:phosphorylase [Terriglobia bacterium]